MSVCPRQPPPGCDGGPSGDAFSPWSKGRVRFTCPAGGWDLWRRAFQRTCKRTLTVANSAKGRCNHSAWAFMPATQGSLVMLMAAVASGLRLDNDHWKAADMIVWREMDMQSRMLDFGRPLLRTRPSVIHSFAKAPNLGAEHMHPGILNKRRVALALGRREEFWDVYAPTFCCVAGVRSDARKEEFVAFHAGVERHFSARHRGDNAGVWVAKPLGSGAFAGKGIEILDTGELRADPRAAALHLWEALWQIVARSGTQYMLQMAIPRPHLASNGTQRWHLRAVLSIVTAPQVAHPQLLLPSGMVPSGGGNGEHCCIALLAPPGPASGASHRNHFVTNLHSSGNQKAGTEKKPTHTIKMTLADVARADPRGQFLDEAWLLHIMRRIVSVPELGVQSSLSRVRSVTPIGCDFMFTRNFDPYFLECNGNAGTGPVDEEGYRLPEKLVGQVTPEQIADNIKHGGLALGTSFSFQTNIESLLFAGLPCEPRPGDGQPRTAGELLDPPAEHLAEEATYQALVGPGT